jgi:UDP-N-acetylmuramoyl-L-alanyl-D-glutamate--2,6-diaminopimelate ligase
MSMPAEFLANGNTLDRLLQDIADAPAIEVAGIAADSRCLRPGDVFFAVQGATSHGLDYLEQALEAGVAAIVWDSSTGSEIHADVPVIAVEGLAERLGEIANRWFDNPSRAVRMTGVTGTNGKTTVAWLAAECFNLLEQKAGYIGTLGKGIGGVDGEGAMTTPPCLELHEMIAAFRDEGAEHAALEVSSHALEQRRIDGITFDSAIFTNLSRDHIDYHGSMEAYFETKAALFLDYEVRNRIVSLDTEYGVELADRCGANVVTVSSQLDRGTNGRPYVFVRSVVAGETGSHIMIRSSWGEAELDLPLPGDFNVANACEVLALLLCNDVTLEDACDVLGRVKAPPGRMQLVNPTVDDGLPQVYVDYSHTPASLEAALGALRLHCSGALWCVFGCGGDRDRGKRPMMGKVAERLADHVVVTSDNPRSEPPEDIIADIREGMERDAVATADRAAAISYAISAAGSNDIVLIAGKGHEDYQVIGNRTTSFLDFDVAARCLAAKGGPKT